MDISALDLITLAEDVSVREGYENAVDLAKKIDEWGYKRLWFAEHHGSPSQISSAPEILATYVSAVTKNIRVGTGGTMIMHYSPLKVAENFKTLATLAPGRVDLGIGRAPGGGENAIYALSEGNRFIPSELYGKAQTILNFISETPREEALYAHIDAAPTNIPILPEAWMLGSSGNSAVQTGAMGVGYSFAKFFGITNAPQDIFKYYKNNFKPSKFLDQPNAMSTYQVVVAETKDEVDYIAKPLEISRYLQQYGRFEPTMSPEKAKDFDVPSEMKSYIEDQYKERFLIKGTPNEVADILYEEKEKYGFDEIMVYSPIYNHQNRLKSYKLLKDALYE